MKKTILTTLVALGPCLGAFATTIAQWDFNDNPSDLNALTGTVLPAIGSGIAAAAGAPVGTGGVAYDFTAAGASSDPAGGDPNNSNFRMQYFPVQGTGNKTRGAQFTVNTTGYENITLVWDHFNSATANKYWRVQYSTDNGTTWVDHNVIVNNLSAAWNNQVFTASFIAIPGANNNPNFGVRLMSEFQSTAVGGAASYVAVGGGTYGASSGGLRLDMVTFSGVVASGRVSVITEPTNQVVAVGQPASFSVVAGGGTSTIGYQWRKNGSTITGATQASYALAAAQHADAGSYDVVVTNAVNSATSAVATLTVRDPLNLAWTGQSGLTWDNATVSWVNTSTLGNVAYAGGDHVLFDSRGSAATSVDLAESLNPSSVTVDADFDYVLFSSSGGKIVSTTGLTKRGTGTLTLNTDNSYTGPTVIQAGTVQLGAADTRGSMGIGPVTNNGALVFKRSDSIVVANNITGSGGLTNLGKAVTLTGTNIYNGPIAVNSGNLSLSGNHTVNSTDVTVTALSSGLGGATRFGISGGITVGSGTRLSTAGTTTSGDFRVVALSSAGGTNAWNGDINLVGAGMNTIQVDNAGTELQVNGNIDGTALVNPATLMFRGGGSHILLNGRVTMNTACYVTKTDASTWTIASTGNVWDGSVLQGGTLRIGADDAFPPTGTLDLGNGAANVTVDLNGFNQTFKLFQDGSPAPTTGTRIVGNGSTTSDSILTVSAPGGWISRFGGWIQDTFGTGTRKTGLTVAGGGSLILTNSHAQTYSGNTTIDNGSILQLVDDASIPSSPAFILSAGSTMDASARSDATLTLGSTQTLKGDGSFTIGGNLVNNGTIELKVDKTSGTVSNDKVAVSGQVTYGGTLRLVLSGQNLSPTDSIPVFAAGSYASSSFATIDPAIPAPGLTWDTSTLATDGTLRIAGTVPPTIDSTVLSPSGTDIIFGGTGGPANGTFSVLASTDVAAPLATWATVQTGSFDGSGNFSVTIAIAPGVPQRFFTLQVP